MPEHLFPAQCLGVPRSSSESLGTRCGVWNTITTCPVSEDPTGSAQATMSAGWSAAGSNVALPPRSAEGWWSVQVIDASILAHADDQRPCGTGVGLGTIALQSAAGGAWSINFWPGVDQWHTVEYLSALRAGV